MASVVRHWLLKTGPYHPSLAQYRCGFATYSPMLSPIRNALIRRPVQKVVFSLTFGVIQEVRSQVTNDCPSFLIVFAWITRWEKGRLVWNRRLIHFFDALRLPIEQNFTCSRSFAFQWAQVPYPPLKSFGQVCKKQAEWSSEILRGFHRFSVNASNDSSACYRDLQSPLMNYAVL